MFQLNPAPKVKHKRNKPTAKQRGSISHKVRAEVEKRSGNRCERCGKYRSAVWTLEMAHITRRWAQDGLTTANDLVHLCGPSTNSGTCHHFADYTRAGREWLKQFQNHLISD
jgi:ribosomal protein S14